MKKQPLLPQLVEIVLKTQHQIIGRDQVDAGAGGVEQGVDQRVLLKATVVRIAQIAIRFDIQPQGNFFQRGQAGGDIDAEQLFADGRACQTPGHAVDHILLQPAQVSVAVAKQALVEKRLFKRQLNDAISLKAQKVFMTQVQTGGNAARQLPEIHIVVDAATDEIDIAHKAPQ